LKFACKTRIICTIGPASQNKEVLRGLVKNGLNIARLNFSHGSHESHRQAIRMIRDVSEELGIYIGILSDLQGPKIRLEIGRAHV
jgi:pyruvate kinase